jgi:hypothetical protein
LLAIGYAAVVLIMRDDEWAERVKNLLKVALKQRGVGYRELAEKLTAMGAPETDRNIANKITRCGFMAAFLLQCLAAIECQTVQLPYEQSPKLVNNGTKAF